MLKDDSTDATPDPLNLSLELSSHKPQDQSLKLSLPKYLDLQQVVSKDKADKKAVQKVFLGDVWEEKDL